MKRDVLAERRKKARTRAAARRRRVKRGLTFAQIKPFDGREQRRSGSARKRRSFRLDLTPAKLAENRERALQAFSRFRAPGDHRRRTLAPLTGLLDQDRSVEAGLWWERALIRALWKHRRRLRRGGADFQLLMLTVVSPSGSVGFDGLQDFDLDKLRKKMQPYAKALPPGSFFAGMLEADWVIDRCAAIEHWIWHGHFIVLVPAADSKQARELVHKAFPVKADPSLGILRPVLAKVIRRRRGGLVGAVRYMGKALQIHGVHRKVITLNAKTGKRGSPQKQHLSPAELARWAGFAVGVEPDRLLVWSGYRRYGDHLVATSKDGEGG